MRSIEKVTTVILLTGSLIRNELYIYARNNMDPADNSSAASEWCSRRFLW